MTDTSDDDEALELATVISARCRSLELAVPELVRRLGYRNIDKGIRRLRELFDGDLVGTKAILDALPSALDLPDAVVDHAIAATRDQLHRRKRKQVAAELAAWRAAFRPHAIILTERTTPQPLFVAAVFGVERILKIEFEESAKPVNFVQLALAGIQDRLTRWRTVSLPGFGRPTGVVVNYSPDFALEVDLDGQPRRRFDAAYRPGHVDLLHRGHPVPSGVLSGFEVVPRNG